MQTRHQTGLAVLTVTALALGAPDRSAAQATDTGAITQYVSQEKSATPDAQRPQGWEASGTLGGTFNLAHNRFVVGQVEGLSMLLGVSALGTTSYRKDKHEWRNNLSVAETWAKTPVLDEFVKSNDVVDLETLYNYYLTEWTGPFARLALQTAAFKTERVTAEPVTYVRDGDTADPPTAVATTQRFRLASALQPFTINESVGWFAEPVRTVPFNLVGRAGFGGRHTFADGARLITDDKNTAAIRFVELDDVHQAGAELFAGVDGKSADGRLQYGAGVSVLFPLLTNDDTDRSTLELTRVAGQGLLGVGIFDWMSLNYLIKVTSDPQLLSEVQVQNSLLLTVSLSASTQEKPEPVAPEDPAVQALREQLASAEARAAKAEEAVRETQQGQDGAESSTPAAPAAAPSPNEANEAPAPSTP